MSRPTTTRQSKPMFNRHHNEFEQLKEKLRELAYFVLGEEIMSQVQFTVAITVAPAANPLAEGSSSGSASFTQNVQGSIILTPITGGVPPYTAAVDPASPSALPAGLAPSIDASNNLILSGTPTESGSASVVLDAIDSQGNVVSQTRANINSLRR
jgi:hypothetical protein